MGANKMRTTLPKLVRAMVNFLCLNVLILGATCSKSTVDSTQPDVHSTSGIYFDEGAFDSAGVPRPAPGWTWEDFRKSAAALTRKNGDGICYGYM